jgi:hypothetical protein
MNAALATQFITLAAIVAAFAYWDFRFRHLVAALTRIDATLTLFSDRLAALEARKNGADPFATPTHERRVAPH